MQRTAIILACFFICATSHAQEYPFVQYTPKDGLVSSRVKKCYQDSKGRMYFLTYGGLSVFDGARFRNYTIQNGLPHNVVNDILDAGDDSLLLACNTRSLIALVRGKLITLKTRGVPCPVINQFYKHDDGRIYLSSDEGLFSLEGNRIVALNTSLLTEERHEAPLLGNITGLGNYLVITTNDMKFNKGVFLYDIKADRICDESPASGFLLGKDWKNRIWYSTLNKIQVIDNTALGKGKLLITDPVGAYQQVKNYSAFNVTFDTTAISFVFRNKDFRNSEIRRVYETGAISSIPLPKQTTVTYIKNMFIDRENTIWLGNDGEGVFKIINSPLQILENPVGKSTGTSVGNAYYFNGNTWYSSITTRVFRRTAGKLQEYNYNTGSPVVVFNETGKKLFAFDGQHIYEGDPKDQLKLIAFKKLITLPAGDFFTKRMIVDRNGAIISSQLSGVTVWIHNKMACHIPIEKNEIVEAFYFDRNGRLWIVKRSGGIDVYELHSENPSRYLEPVLHFRQNEILGSIRSFVIDKNGTIWIGTRENGLVAYVQKDKELKQLYHFYSGNGLTDDFVTALTCDSLNNIIVGTQTGLDRIKQDSLNSYRIENLSRRSNFYGYITQVWADPERAYALTQSGTLLQLSPVLETKRSIIPRLLLEEIRINGGVVAGKKQFSHAENNISLLLAAPSFIDEKQVTYTYLLKGSGNNNWSDTSITNASINLINLSPGKYNLIVRAFFPSNIYAAAEMNYSFKIAPPWWATWWFKGLVGLFVLFACILAIRIYYNRRFQAQRAALEKEQAIKNERTRIATDMHDDLGAGLSRIKFLSETIGIKKQTQQPIEEDIGKIREYSHEMIDKMGEIVWALNEKNDSLSDLLSYTRVYAMEYLSQNGIKCTLDIPDELPQVPVTGEFRRNIYLTVKEALHNVVKHAHASGVVIKIHAADILEIIIEDNGTGFKKDDTRPFSNGLTNMEARVKVIGGEFLVVNGKGTQIKITVPLPE
jgi:signal transduction histidine kinase